MTTDAPRPVPLPRAPRTGTPKALGAAGAPVLHIEEPPPAVQPGWALWALGFRPFYLMAALYAALAVPLWALQFAGVIRPLWPSAVWHAHEMVFGYTLAIVVGFLFTAGRNWSNQPTPTGAALAALAALWIAARLLTLGPWPVAALAANVAFPLVAAWALWRALHAGRNARNYFFVALLVAMGAAVAMVHAVQRGWLQAPAGVGVQTGLDVVAVIISVMAGRVLPMFTNNGVRGAQAERRPWLEKAATGVLLVLLAVGLLAAVRPVPATAVALLCAVAAVLHAGRWWLWQPWATRQVPLVWVLHLAYAWLPVHLLLRAAAALGWIAPGPAQHAFTVGVIGLLTLGMITRTARGHTGRLLAADRADVCAYVLLAAGAFVRVFWPLAQPSATVHAALVSALAWSAAFAIYFVHYLPWLTRSRADGRSG